MSLVILGAVSTALISSMHANQRETAANDALTSSDVALARILRDVRVATKVSDGVPEPNVPAGFGIELTMPDATKVDYYCPRGGNGNNPYPCYRKAAGGSGLGATLIGAVVNSQNSNPTNRIFRLSCGDDLEGSCGSGPATYVGVHLLVKTACDGRASQQCDAGDVELKGGAAVRNSRASGS
jgi:hypothetical protein